LYRSDQMVSKSIDFWADIFDSDGFSGPDSTTRILWAIPSRCLDG